MQNVRSFRLGQAAVAAALLFLVWPMQAVGLDLFGQHRVNVQFATADGKPLADAEVRVFAPGRPDQPALTGRTDSRGRFEFAADEDGFWSAEARTGGEIARVMIRVGGKQQDEKPLSPYWMVGALVLLLILAFVFRTLRARTRGPHKEG